MKKTVLLSAISLLVAATSCVKEEVIKENPVPGGEQPAAQAPTLGIASENTLFTASDSQNATLAFKSLGGEVVVYVNTNVTDWEVKPEGDNLADVTADKVAGTLPLTAKRNTQTRQLAARYTIKAGDLTATISATQNAYGTPEIVASETGRSAPTPRPIRISPSKRTAKFDETIMSSAPKTSMTMVTENTGLRPKRSPRRPPKMEPKAMQKVSAAESRAEISLSACRKPKAEE